MFKIFANRRKAKVAHLYEIQQHSLDSMRYHYASDQNMQLHLDRMQTALELLQAA